jgi:eukaryotic-like serine/threonine-protein kinase
VQNELVVDPIAAPRGPASGPSGDAPKVPPSFRAAGSARRVRTLPHRIGRYTLFSHIGRGGMADIYLASAETELGALRLVVIKEVLPEFAHRPSFAEMLVREAKLAARLNHANIVKVEDLGRAGSLYIAMEYVEGVDLREMLRRAAKAKVPVPIEFSLHVVCDVLRGLGFAHRARGDDGRRLQIVHRDVSPSNVLLSFEGEVKLCDFGIARAAELCEAAADATARAGLVEGKAGYMSPEQARGEALDERSDVFATGIVLWELLAGRRLYKAQPGEPLLEVARRSDIPALPLRDLPFEDELHAIVARALARSKDDRFPTAAAMLGTLEAYALKARFVASPLRFGEWLTQHFAREVVGPRRAGERAMRALAMGPAAVISPIEDVTPSTFAVVDRIEADEADEADAEPAPVARNLAKPRKSGRSFPWLVVAAVALVAVGSLLPFLLR